MNVPCSAWNLNQVSESFIKSLSCRRWKINVKSPSNLRPITEYRSINILFNQNSCLNETVKMAWVIFKVYIIYTLHSIFFFKRWNKGKSLRVGVPVSALLGRGCFELLWPSCNLWGLSKQRLKHDAVHFSSANSQNLMTQDQLNLL